MDLNSLWLPAGLVALNLYALLLVVARGPVFGTRIYRPMILNIGLSLAPAAMMAVGAAAMLMIVLWSGSTSAPAWIPSTLVWLTLIVFGSAWFLLLPNAAYLITELNMSHRAKNEKVPLWYDIVLVMTLALSGIFNTLANIALAQIFIAILFDEPGYHAARDPRPWIAIIFTVLAISFGIYIGRYLRLNSWDMLHPGSLFRKFAQHFRAAGNLKAALGFVLIHSILLVILYAIVLLPSVSRLLVPTTGG